MHPFTLHTAQIVLPAAALVATVTFANQQTPPAPAAPTAPQATTIASTNPKPGTADGNAMAAAARMAWAETIEANCNPAVVADVVLRDAIKSTGLPWRVRDRATGIEMVLIPAGKFNMGMSIGDANANDDERPVHEVILTHPFYLGRTEVTQDQWTKLMGSNPSYFQDVNFQAMPDEDREAKLAAFIEAGYTRQEAQQKLGPDVMSDVVTSQWPVETVTFEDVQGFLRKTGLRLPSEGEWEFACRAGSRDPIYGQLDQIAWTTENSEDRTHSVGTKFPNALGLYDMIGNVWEWTNDWYAADYYRACENGATDPTGAAQNPFRVLRGGSWDHDAKNCRASFRLNHFTGDPRITDYGFRVARTP